VVLFNSLLEGFMSSYKVSFKGSLSINWSLEHKPSRKDIKDSLINAILEMSPKELAEYIKITTMEEIVN
jgi:hypothetical protein